MGPDGEVVPSPSGPLVIPWDDPYHFFKGIPAVDDEQPEENVANGSPAEGKLRTSSLTGLEQQIMLRADWNVLKFKLLYLCQKKERKYIFAKKKSKVSKKKVRVHYDLSSFPF